jgi:hypothetical protein
MTLADAAKGLRRKVGNVQCEAKPQCVPLHLDSAPKGETAGGKVKEGVREDALRSIGFLDSAQI